MEPAQHGQPEHDAERSWLRGRIFRCTTCNEEVRVNEGGDDAIGSEPPG